jgi:hypothetical protein
MRDTGEHVMAAPKTTTRKKPARGARPGLDFDLQAGHYQVSAWMRDRYYTDRIISTAPSAKISREDQVIVERYLSRLSEGQTVYGGDRQKVIGILNLTLDTREKAFDFLIWELQRPELPLDGEVTVVTRAGTVQPTATQGSTRAMLVNYIRDQMTQKQEPGTFLEHVMVPIDLMVFYAHAHNITDLTLKAFSPETVTPALFDEFTNIYVSKGGMDVRVTTTALKTLFEQDPSLKPPGYNPETFTVRGEAMSESRRVELDRNNVIRVRGGWVHFPRHLTATGVWAFNPFGGKWDTAISQTKEPSETVTYTWDDYLDFINKFLRGSPEKYRVFVRFVFTSGLRISAASCLTKDSMLERTVVKDALGREFVAINPMLGLQFCKSRKGTTVSQQKRAPEKHFIPLDLYDALLHVYQEEKKIDPATQFIFGPEHDRMTTTISAIITQKKTDPKFLRTLSGVQRKDFKDYTLHYFRATWATAIITTMREFKAISDHLSATWSRRLQTTIEHYSGRLTMPQAVELIQKAPIFILPEHKAMIDDSIRMAIRESPQTEEVIQAEVTKGVEEKIPEIEQKFEQRLTAALQQQQAATETRITSIMDQMRGISQQIALLNMQIPRPGYAVPAVAEAPPPRPPTPVPAVDADALKAQMDQIQRTLNTLKKRK